MKTNLLVLASLLLPASFAQAAGKAKPKECAVAITTAPQAEQSPLLDEYGNLKNPEDAWLRNPRGLKSFFTKPKEIPDVAQKAPIEGREAQAYFVQDFRQELQALIDSREIDISQMKELDGRLIQIENLETKKQFYIYRGDDLKVPFSEIDMKRNTKIWVFSHEPDSMKSDTQEKFKGRMLNLRELAFTTEREEMDRRAKASNTFIPYRELYKLSNGGILEILGVYHPRDVTGSKVKIEVLTHVDETDSLTFDSILAGMEQNLVAPDVDANSSGLDQYGNLLNPEDAKLRDAGRIKSLLTGASKVPETIQKAPIKMQQDQAYFLRSFRPELEGMINRGQMDPSLLTDLKSRLLNIESYKTKRQFYLLRTDDLKTPLSKLETGYVLVFSHEPNLMVVQSGWMGPTRMMSLGSLGMTETHQEKNLREQKSYDQSFREVFRVSDGNTLVLAGTMRKYGKNSTPSVSLEVKEISKGKPGEPVNLDDVVRMLQYKE